MTASSSQGALRHPLTGLLGTASSVRVLRELALHGGDLGSATLARRSGLAIQQVRRALGSLQEQRMIDVLGSGHARLFKLRMAHPLAPALDALFTAEAAAYRAIWNSLLKKAVSVEGRAHGIWLYGSTARMQDQPGSDLDLVVVSDEPQETADILRRKLIPLEQRRGLTASVVGLDLADVARLATGHDPWWDALLRDAKLLAGASPLAVLEQALVAVPG